MLIVFFLTLAALSGWAGGFSFGKRYGARRCLRKLREELDLPPV